MGIVAYPIKPIIDTLQCNEPVPLYGTSQKNAEIYNTFIRYAYI